MGSCKLHDPPLAQGSKPHDPPLLCSGPPPPIYFLTSPLDHRIKRYVTHSSCLFRFFIAKWTGHDTHSSRLFRLTIVSLPKERDLITQLFRLFCLIIAYRTLRDILHTLFMTISGDLNKNFGRHDSGFGRYNFGRDDRLPRSGFPM